MATHPLKASALALAALLVVSCQTTGKDAAPLSAHHVPADDNLNAVLWMQRSAEYTAVVEGVYRAATAQLDTALATPGDALLPSERGSDDPNLPPAIVVDIDETVLDNSPYQARLISTGREYHDSSWEDWVGEAAARAIPGAVAFAREAQARGITLLYVSNRSEQSKAATLQNLRAVGLPVKDEQVFFGLGLEVPGCTGKRSEKRCRRLLASQHYRIVMQLGDQLGDFLEVPHNRPFERQQLVEQHAAYWGQRWFMLPNPSYGGWESALFNNEHQQPRAWRRESKRKQLLDGTKQEN